MEKVKNIYVILYNNLLVNTVKGQVIWAISFNLLSKNVAIILQVVIVCCPYYQLQMQQILGCKK